MVHGVTENWTKIEQLSTQHMIPTDSEWEVQFVLVVQERDYGPRDQNCITAYRDELIDIRYILQTESTGHADVISDILLGTFLSNTIMGFKDCL